MLRIDSHQHFWIAARGDYGWLRADDPASAPLARDFLPQHLAPLLAAGEVQQTVLVQAAESLEESAFLLDLAAQCDCVAAVVGWVDLSRADAPERIEACAAHSRCKGLRPMLQDLPQADWIVQAPDAAAIPAMLRCGLRFDALLRPAQLPHLLRFARAWEQLPIVIDHAAKPELARGWQSDWASEWRRCMAELAALPQVCCKFSGLLTEMSPRQRASETERKAVLRPLWDDLLRCFGSERLMWGSDWPVLTLAGSYAQWQADAGALIGELSPAEQAQVWGGTAQRFYGLAPPSGAVAA